MPSGDGGKKRKINRPIFGHLLEMIIGNRSRPSKADFTG